MKTKDLTIKKINPVTTKVESLKILDNVGMVEATTLLSQCNKQLDILTEEKKKLTDPLNQTMKEIRARYKPAEDLLANAIVTLKSKMSGYQTEALRIQSIEQKKIADKVASGKMGIEKAMVKMDAIDSPDERVKTDAGSVSFRLVKKFEIVDIKKIPYEYLIADEVSIRKAMLLGKEISGVRYFEEQSIINKRN